MLLIRPLSTVDLPALRDIAGVAEAEGFRFVQRLLEDVAAGEVHFNEPCEFFLGVFVDECLVAIGGVTPDPYIDDVSTGRLRHVYVHAERRRTGIGRELVARLERRAEPCYAYLRLRTDTSRAAQFYESLGYQRTGSDSATHMRVLSERAGHEHHWKI